MRLKTLFRFSLCLLGVRSSLLPWACLLRKVPSGEQQHWGTICFNCLGTGLCAGWLFVSGLLYSIWWLWVCLSWPLSLDVWRYHLIMIAELLKYWTLYKYFLNILSSASWVAHFWFGMCSTTQPGLLIVTPCQAKLLGPKAYVHPFSGLLPCVLGPLSCLSIWIFAQLYAKYLLIWHFKRNPLGLIVLLSW